MIFNVSLLKLSIIDNINEWNYCKKHHHVPSSSRPERLCLLCVKVWEAFHNLNGLWTEQSKVKLGIAAGRKHAKSSGDVSYHPSKESEKGTERPHKSLMGSFMTCVVDKKYHCTIKVKILQSKVALWMCLSY